MSLFANLSNDGLEESQDRAGGSFGAINSGIYTGKVKALYAGKSKSGANSMTLIMQHDGKEYRETLWITNKDGKNYFLNKDDNTKKVPLPGFTIVDELCLVTTGKPLCEQEFEEKVINVYDYEAKKELPKSVMMATEVLGQEVSLGILKQLENKNEKQGDEYVAIADTRELNIIDKVFHTETRMTVPEARNGVESAVFWDTWLTKNKDQVRDKRTIKDGQGGSTTATKAPPKAGASSDAAPRKSLFAK